MVDGSTGTPKQAAKSKKPAPMSDRELAALERGNHGPMKVTIARLIESVRAAREESEERGWRLTELETQVAREKEERDNVARRSTARALLVVACDGYTEVFADQTVSLKVVNLLPWEDGHEMMLNEKSHWAEIWSPGRVRTTVLPHYLKAPNLMLPEDVSRALEWEQRERIGKAVVALTKELDEIRRKNRALDAAAKAKAEATP